MFCQFYPRIENAKLAIVAQDSSAAPLNSRVPLGRPFSNPFSSELKASPRGCPVYHSRGPFVFAPSYENTLRHPASKARAVPSGGKSSFGPWKGQNLKPMAKTTVGLVHPTLKT